MNEKKYYFHDGFKEVGPLTIDELILKNIDGNTPVGHDGLEKWTRAGLVEELTDRLNFRKPPPYVELDKKSSKEASTSQGTSSKKINRVISTFISITTILVIFYVVINLYNNPNSIPGVKLEINTPKPVVISSRADKSKSDIKLRVTVYATIQNQGGDGNVSVTFYLMQDGNTYERTKIIYLSSNDSKDIDVTFDEARRLGGDISYKVESSIQ